MHRTKMNRGPSNGAVVRKLSPTVAISHEHRGIQPPQSSNRKYSPEELTTAARMLQKLRQQHDTHLLVESIDMDLHHPENVVEIAIDRILATV